MATTIQNKVAENESAANGKKTLQTLIKSMEGEIKKALPSVITPERFTRMVYSALSTNPVLGSCTPQSFLGAMMSAAQLGLEPNTPLGQAYLIPYKNDGTLEVQFQIGYKGLIDLAYRSDEIEVIQAHIVHENDEFKCEYGLEPKLVHVPADKDRGVPVKAYAMFKTKSGGFGFEVMSMEEIREHARKYSKTFSSKFSPWTNNFDEMAKKTVLKKVLKYAPLKSDFVKAVVQDETVKTNIDEEMYTVADSTVYDAEYKEVDASTGEVK